MSTASLRASPTDVDIGDPTVAQLLHDLRNELTVILSCVDDLVRLQACEPFGETIVELQRGGMRAILLSKELLAAPRPARSPSQAQPPVDLNDIVAPTAATVSRLTGGRQDVRLRLASQPVPVLAERLDLERLLLNLLLNACDATNGDGLVAIDTAVVATAARLTVTDSGCGVTPEVKRRMFDPYFTTKPTSTGLGLSSVARIVRNLGGSIAIDSEPGRGTAVSIMLPLASELHCPTRERWSPT